MRYPEVEVQLIGSDGNGLAIVTKISKALRRHGVSDLEIASFITESTSGDYDHLLQTCMEWVDVT